MLRQSGARLKIADYTSADKRIRGAGNRLKRPFDKLRVTARERLGTMDSGLRTCLAYGKTVTPVIRPVEMLKVGQASSLSILTIRKLEAYATQ